MKPKADSTNPRQMFNLTAALLAEREAGRLEGRREVWEEAANLASFTLAGQLRKEAIQLQQTADDWQDMEAAMPTMHAPKMALVTLLRDAAVVLDDAQCVLDTFRQAEAQGYRSRERQYVIDILGRHFPLQKPTP